MGILLMFSSMHYEAVHQYLKRLMRSVGQFKNLSKPLCYRYQRRSARTQSECLQLKISFSKTFVCHQSEFESSESLES